MAKKTRKSAAKTPPAREAAARDRICNLVPSRATERDWRFSQALASGALTAAVAAPPASVDLRKAWWKIGDQKNTGACVGWASAEGVVRYHMVTAGRLANNEPLSPRFVWMASKETDTFITRPETFIEGAGTSLKAAMDICRKYGAATEQQLPFVIDVAMYTGDEDVFFAAAAQRRIASYFNLGRDLNQWKTWLASHGPILAGLSVDQAWDDATSTHGNLDVFAPNTVRGGHAVAIVGYQATGRFIIRNSWGTAWGDKGFAYASPAYINAAFFTESYGVTV
jgi:hypothetical protein